MRNVKLPGGTHEVGARQGYDGISVLGTTETVVIGGVERDMVVCKMVYELDESEKQALLEGGRLVLTMLTQVVVPHRLEVQSV